MQSYDKFIYTKLLGPTSNTLAIVLPIVIVGVLALIVTVIIVTVVALVLKKLGTGTYSPQKAELDCGVNLQEKDKTNEESVAEQEKDPKHTE